MLKDPATVPTKKISFYYSDEILMHDNKYPYSRNESMDYSTQSTTAHKITDLNIEKLIEDLEYDEIKKCNSEPI